MPKINTYTNASPISGSDKLIGTDALSSNMTKNFVVSDLSQYIIAQIPSSGFGLQGILNNGNTATQDINLTGEINLIGDLSVTGTFKDSLASVGVSGQFLKSTGTGTAWGNAPTLNEVLTQGASSAVNVTLTGALYSTEARIIKLRDYLNSAGTSGQALFSTGTQVYWGNIITPNIDSVLAAGSSTTRNMTTTGGITAGNFTATNYVKPTVVLDRLNSPGIANQILKSTATGVEWVTASLAPQDLASVLAVGNSATSNMTLTGDLSVSGIATLGKIKDAVASVGTAGQVLSSTGSALSWITLPSTPTLNQVLAAGNTATNTINLTGSINMSGALAVGGTVKPLSITDSTNAIGTAGQILSSTGTALRWVNPASTPTLTQVLTAGNTTTLDITTTGFMRPATIKDSLGNIGTSGQVLTSTGTTMLWSAVPTPAVPSLSQVLNIGNTATNSMTITGAVSATTLTGTTSIDSPLGIFTTLRDGSSSIGTVGQVLSSTGSGLQWVTISTSTPTIAQVLTAGGNAGGNSISGIGFLFASNLFIGDGSFSNITTGTITDAGSSIGTNGQVLSSTGTTIQWITLPSTTPTLNSVLTAGSISGQSMTINNIINAANLVISTGAVKSNNYTTVSGTGYFNMYGPTGTTTLALGSFNSSYTSTLTTLVVGAQTDSTLQVGITGGVGNTVNSYFNMYATTAVVWSIGGASTSGLNVGFESLSSYYGFAGSTLCEFEIGTTSNTVGSVHVYIHALTVHSNNTAAVAAGLTVGELYRDSSGHVAVVY